MASYPQKYLILSFFYSLEPKKKQQILVTTKEIVTLST